MEKKRMIQIIRSVKGTLMAHPDNEDNSEFADRISSLKELEQALSMSGVVERSEQLKAFLTWLEKEGGSPFIDKDALIDDWLKSL